MKEHDGSIPVDGTANLEDVATENSEKVSSTLEDEKQIEEEVLQTEQEDNFDSEETTWDGSESEFVEDDDAEEYEEHYAGIKFGYALKKEEIFSCLKHTGMFKVNGTRSIVEICLLLVLALMFFILFFVGFYQVCFVFSRLLCLLYFF